MTSQPPVLDAMDISNEITTETTNNTPLFAEDAEISNELTDSTPNKSNSTTAAKNKNKRRKDVISINLHFTDNKKVNAIKKTIEYGAEIVFKNHSYTTPVAFEFYSAKTTNRINVFESHKKVFAVMKMIDNTTNIITKKGKYFDYPDSFSEGQVYLEQFSSISDIQRERKVLYDARLNHQS